MRFWPQTNQALGYALREKPERVVLDVPKGVAPSSKPPVRIFLGTEPAHYRAERVFVWSIEQVRDPSRVYEIYLMKDLAGFNRHWWLTGFTNYRFAIPSLAGSTGRALYNDVDQIYLADPGELFDTDMGGHGFLAYSPQGRVDTAVMLIDCARMVSVWTIEGAQRERKQSLIRKALAVPGLWGDLAAQWHAREEEYRQGGSKVLHYTILHTQPWHPFPRRYVYQRNPLGQLWHELEHSADLAGYQLFSSTHPSSLYSAMLARIQTAGRSDERERSTTPGHSFPSEEVESLRDLIARTEAKTILQHGVKTGPGGHDRGERILAECSGPTVMRYDPASPPAGGAPSGTFDGVVSSQWLEYLPDEDVPWVVEELFRCAGRFLFVSLDSYSPAQRLNDGALLRRRSWDPSFWNAQFDAAGSRHPDVRWQLVVHARGPMGRKVTTWRQGGRSLGGPPTIWVLKDHKPGHTTQSVGLAEALGWPYQMKELHLSLFNLAFNFLLAPKRISLNKRRSGSLTPPWPDLVIGTGCNAAPVARWIRAKSRGRTRVVLQGRKCGPIADMSDIAISCTHFHLPFHPRRIEIVAPLNRVSPERLTQAAERWSHVFKDAPKPHVVLLVGGASPRHRLDAETARRLGKDVRAFAEAARGSVFALTSRRTGQEATEALEQGLGQQSHVCRWRPGEWENPYLGYLACADVLVVTGESESMLAESAMTGKPVYIYPLSERKPGLGTRLIDWIVARAHARPLNKRGTVRPQRGLEYWCAVLVARGIVQPSRDLSKLHQDLVRLGIARMFGEPLEMGKRPALREIDGVAQHVRTLVGVWG